MAGLWLILGLFSDGWAHHNIPELESFFTPWHGVLYSGFVAVALWFAWLGRKGGLRFFERLPLGYGWGALGIAVFAFGGLADMTWHIIFGVEAGLDALLSPSHLVLLAGGLLILSSAIRSRWGAGDTSSFVAMSAVALLTALVSFFLLYVNEFAAHAPTVGFEKLPESNPHHTEAQLPATAGLGDFLITTAVVILPLLLVWQRGRHPRGQLALLVAVLAWLATAIVDFAPEALAGAAGATAGAIVGEFLIVWLERSGLPARLRSPILAASAAASIWTGHLAGLAAFNTVAWSVELTSGVVILSALAAVALGAVGATYDVAAPAVSNDQVRAQGATDE